MTENTISVEIPQETIYKIDHRLDTTSFEDRSDYITFVLEELIFQLESEENDTEVETELENRLESLGYLS